MGEKGAFSCQKGVFADGWGAISAKGKRNVQKGCLFLPEGRLRWREDPNFSRILTSEGGIVTSKGGILVCGAAS